MSRYNSMVITAHGRVVLAKILAGECDIVITRAVTGDGVWEAGDDLVAAEELKSQVQSFGISAFRRENDQILIRFLASNFDASADEGLTVDYYMREIGIYAKEAGTEDEFLYGIVTSDVPAFMPAYSENAPVTITFNTYVYVGDGGRVVIQTDPTAFVLVDEFRSYQEETAENLDTKLDKTGDASDATVTFEQASERENIATGEKLSVLFGKIKKYFSDLKTVAFTGKYRDLEGTPEIPSVGNGTITIKQAGTIKGIFTTNQAEDQEVDLTDSNTTYSAATQSANGLMSASDKKKLDGLNKSAYIGNGTGFIRPNHIGGSDNANDYVKEWHGFVYNMSNLPESYGFLDVTWFDGAGFSPSPPDKGGVVRQVFTSYNTGSAYIRVRINNSWTSWDSLSAKQEKALNDKFANYLPLAGGTIKGTLKVRNPSYPNAGVDVRVDSEGANITLYTKTANKHYEIDTLNDRLRIYQHVNGAITTPAEVDADSKFNINGRAETAVSLTPRTIVTFTMSSGATTTDVGWLNNYLSEGPVYLMVVDTKTQHGKSFYTLRFTSANSPYFNVNLLNGANVVKMSFVGTGYRYEKLSSGPTSSEYEVLFYKLFEI